MKIKYKGSKATILNQFDLLGHNETALAKAFAYMLAKEPIALKYFLRDLKIKTSADILSKTTIETERNRIEGRTDIEFICEGYFHVIIECKVRSNKLTKQKTQYLQSFNTNGDEKIICFITQEYGYSNGQNGNIGVFYRNWLDIIKLFDTKRLRNSAVIREFILYATRGFKMRDQKEVLIQGLSIEKEVRRFEEFWVYRRDETFGTPLYFAPYFSKKSYKDEPGIYSISKILGTLTIKQKDIGKYVEHLRGFAESGNIDDASEFTKEDYVNDWIKGVKIKDEEELKDKTLTYYFLDKPIEFERPLKKDGGIGKGRGKGWIAASIPKNRCVPFDEFAKRIVMAYSNT